jgi:hypothetical protein
VGLMRARASGLLAILLLAMVAVTSAQSMAAARVLPERELRQLFPGRFVAFAYGVARINFVARADGSLWGKMGRADTGIWRLRGEVLCIKFKRWLKGRMRCSTVSKKGDWYVTGPITFKKVGQ